MMAKQAVFRTLACGLVAAVAWAVSIAAQSDRFETKVPFELGEALALNATLGPVKIANVKISNLGRGYGRGGVLRRGSEPSELSTTLRLAFDVSNPGEDWEITYTIEFLDKNGKPIDKVTKKAGYEEESKISNLDHPILEYVVPMISDVRVSLHGRLD